MALLKFVRKEFFPTMLPGLICGFIISGLIFPVVYNNSPLKEKPKIEKTK